MGCLNIFQQNIDWKQMGKWNRKWFTKHKINLSLLFLDFQSEIMPLQANHLFQDILHIFSHQCCL